MSENTQQQANETIVRILGQREHSQRELRQKLKQRGYSAEQIEQALEYAQNYGWQDDTRFALSWVRHGLNRGDGWNKIKASARQKGITDDDLQQAIEELQPDWVDLCYRRLLMKFGEQPATEQRLRDRIMRHLLQRGFRFDEIKKALSLQSEAASD